MLAITGLIRLYFAIPLEFLLMNPPLSVMLYKYLLHYIFFANDWIALQCI